MTKPVITMYLVGLSLLCIGCSDQATHERVIAEGTAQEGATPPESDAMQAEVKIAGANYFYCDPQPDGRHYFHLDPEDFDKAFVGFEFSESYKNAHPDETAPISEMEIAISGSGMRYVNSEMEFHGKGDSGMLTLSDGNIVNCRKQ